MIVLLKVFHHSPPDMKALIEGYKVEYVYNNSRFECCKTYYGLLFIHTQYAILQHTAW